MCFTSRNSNPNIVLSPIGNRGFGVFNVNGYNLVAYPAAIITTFILILHYSCPIRDIAEIFDIAGLDTQIIAASIRNPIHVTDCALAGADIATIPYAVIETMTKHPLTDQGIAKFQADYKKVFGE